MMITQNNLNEIIFENQDARLLIEDVVSHTQACLYYYGAEITVGEAIRIWNNAQKAERSHKPYTRSFLNRGRTTELLCS